MISKIKYRCLQPIKYLFKRVMIDYIININKYISFLEKRITYLLKYEKKTTTQNIFSHTYCCEQQIIWTEYPQASYGPVINTHSPSPTPQASESCPLPPPKGFILHSYYPSSLYSFLSLVISLSVYTMLLQTNKDYYLKFKKILLGVFVRLVDNFMAVCLCLKLQLLQKTLTFF